MPVKDFLLVVKKNCRLRRSSSSSSGASSSSGGGSSGRDVPEKLTTLLGIITAPLLKMATTHQAVAVFRAVTALTHLAGFTI